MARLANGQNPSRQTPSWRESQVDRTSSEHNPELTEPKVDTILFGENVIWPDSKVDKIQDDKHPVREISKKTEPNVSRKQS